MKTGTTFLQERLKGRSARLLDEGTLYPLIQRQGVQDLFQHRGNLYNPNVDGAWEQLVSTVAAAPQRRVVISQELMSTAKPDRVAQIVRAFRPADVHVVLTVRDITRVLPAQWQETVQNRALWTWEEYVGAIVGDRDDPLISNQFADKHDVEAMVREWAGHVSMDHIHIVTVPATASSPDELWERFCAATGITALDQSEHEATPPRNVGLGFASAEFLRRLNVRLGPEIGRQLYVRHVKQVLGKSVAAARTTGTKPGFSVQQRQWALERSERLITFLRNAGVRVVGDLDDLRPAPSDGTEELSAPRDLDVADAALDAVIIMLHRLKELEDTGKPTGPGKGGGRRAGQQKRRQLAGGAASGDESVRPGE